MLIGLRQPSVKFIKPLFLFGIMSQEDIKEQAKRIIDNFAKALESVKAEEESVERDEDRREEKETNEPSPEFRKIILENAPNTKDGCIVAEKGKWAK